MANPPTRALRSKLLERELPVNRFNIPVPAAPRSNPGAADNRPPAKGPLFKASPIIGPYPLYS